MGDATRGQVGGPGESGLAGLEDAVDLAVLSLDWFDWAAAEFWLLQGKRGIWLDLDAVFAQGHNGPWVEWELAGMGVGIHAKAATIVEGALLVLIVVDRRHEQRVRKWLAKLGILV